MDDNLRVAGAVLVQTVAEGHFSPCKTTSPSPGALSSELDLGGSTDPFDLHFGNKIWCSSHRVSIWHFGAYGLRVHPDGCGLMPCV